MKTLVELSEELLEYLLKYKLNVDNQFTFSLRQRNSPQAKEVDRLGEGYWFQGSNYIYIPLFKKGDNARKIKTIGFVVSLNEDSYNNYIEISFKDPTHSDLDLAFHNELAKFQNIELDKYKVGLLNFKNQENIFDNLDYYINEFRFKALELLDKYGIRDRYLITEEKFQKDLTKINNLRKTNYMQISNDHLSLLKYKKQIILQGPPGTGKTRLAKELAKELLFEDVKKSFTENELLAIVKEKQVISTYTDYNTFEVVKVEDNAFTIQPKGAKNTYKVSFSDIINCVQDYNATDLVKKYDKKGVGSYIVGIAKYVVENLENKQHLIVQFHPSYTYEDFVRGIAAKPNTNGDGVLFEAENKTLAILANEALKNYRLSQKGPENEQISDLILFETFISDLKENIAESEQQRISITDAVYLFEPDDKRFKYKGDNWVAHKNGLNMKFSEIQKLIVADVKERQDIKTLSGIEELTRQHATYFIKVVEKFYEFKEKYSTSVKYDNSKVALKNYVLIIDEINRANLSSVLGELIYALEYRNEEVDSMYALDKDRKLILPPNLFIIGTMNTADRSVGHIDYAIRRRFAFVDVLPEKLSEDEKIWFNTLAFEAVEKLFTTSYVSPEFEIKDIQIGHSYFIVKKEDAPLDLDRDLLFKMKMKYEVIPILLEYVRDGILNADAKKIIEEIKISFE